MNKPLRVLILEDSEGDAGLMVRELENAGFRVIINALKTVKK